MRFPSDAPVAQAKLDLLREKILSLKVDLTAVEERFLRSGGPGGQKRNKTASGVQLVYRPLHLQVKSTRERSQALNRFLALRELLDEIEKRLDPDNCLKREAWQRIRRQKDRRRRRRS
mgnify:CR=1 FL=1